MKKKKLGELAERYWLYKYAHEDVEQGENLAQGILIAVHCLGLQTEFEKLVNGIKFNIK